MDYNTLEKIPGSTPGSEFLVIGHDADKGFKAGIRFWMSGMHIVPITEVGFRFRVVRDDAAPPVTNIAHVLKDAYPGVTWSGASTVHGSIQGGIRARVNITDYKELCGLLAQNGTMGAVYDSLRFAFPTMTFAMNRDEFVLFFTSEIEKMGEGMGLPQFVPSDNEKVDLYLKFTGEPTEPNALDQVIEENPVSEKNAATTADILKLLEMESGTHESPDPQSGVVDQVGLTEPAPPEPAPVETPFVAPVPKMKLVPGNKDS